MTCPLIHEHFPRKMIRYIQIGAKDKILEELYKCHVCGTQAIGPFCYICGVKIKRLKGEKKKEIMSFLSDGLTKIRK